MKINTLWHEPRSNVGHAENIISWKSFVINFINSLKYLGNPGLQPVSAIRYTPDTISALGLG